MRCAAETVAGPMGRWWGEKGCGGAGRHGEDDDPIIGGRGSTSGRREKVMPLELSC